MRQIHYIAIALLLVMYQPGWAQTTIITGPEGTTSIIKTSDDTTSIIHSPRPVEWPPGRK